MNYKGSSSPDAVFFIYLFIYFWCGRDSIGEEGVQERAVLLCDSELNDKVKGQIFFIGAFGSGIDLLLFPLAK